MVFVNWINNTLGIERTANIFGQERIILIFRYLIALKAWKKPLKEKQKRAIRLGSQQDFAGPGQIQTLMGL